MKSNKTRQLILIGTLTTLVTTVACSSKPKPTVVTSVAPPKPVSFVRPEAPKSVAFTTETTPTKPVEKSADKPKSVAVTKGEFKSHDYSVSFDYPWQYTRMGARTIAADYSLQPQSDGLSSQITLVRIDVPKGFYPGSDFDSAYFTLSLNSSLSEKECKATLGKDPKPEKTSINGSEFRWVETESGGHGSSAKVRNYVTYTNDTCYEIETGVRTKNDGTAREIDANQVMKRLDTILATVKIGEQPKSPSTEQLLSSKDPQPGDVHPEAGK